MSSGLRSDPSEKTGGDTETQKTRKQLTPHPRVHRRHPSGELIILPLGEFNVPAKTKSTCTVQSNTHELPSHASTAVFEQMGQDK